MSDTARALRERVARALNARCFDGCEDGEAGFRACVDPPCPCREAANAAIDLVLEEAAKVADLYAKAALKCKSCGDTCHDYAPGGCTGEANYKISEAYKTRVAFDGAYEAMRYFEKHICRPEEMTTEEAFKDFATAIRALKSGNDS